MYTVYEVIRYIYLKRGQPEAAAEDGSLRAGLYVASCRDDIAGVLQLGRTVEVEMEAVAVQLELKFVHTCTVPV